VAQEWPLLSTQQSASEVIAARRPAPAEHRQPARNDLPSAVARREESGQPAVSCELRYQDYLATDNRRAFDGLRGLGFLLVVTAHVPSVRLFDYLQGWAAVWIFLVMSGYLVTMLMTREEKRVGRIAFGAFLVRRFFRIVPSYWMAILLYWLACYALPPLQEAYPRFMTRLPAYLAFMPEYADTDGYSIFTHAWTVGVELKFYLLFPPVLFLMLKNANWRFAATAIAAALFDAHGAFLAEAYCAVLFGAMLALSLEQPGGYAFITKLTRVPAVVPLALIVGLLALLHFGERFMALAAVMTYLLAYTIVQESAVSRVLTWRPLAYIGQRSYGAYLLHFLALRTGYMIFGDDSTTSGLLAAGFCLVLAVPAAELLYRTIERPGRDYGQGLLSRVRIAAVAQTSATPRSLIVDRAADTAGHPVS
jgi:peptidoglycan/LPS O-acetylase OafA/YrhL